VQNIGKAVIDFLARFNDANAQQTIAAWQFMRRPNDLIDRADRTKTPPCPNQICGLRQVSGLCIGVSHTGV
jgi:hypothetical protein